MGMTKNQEHYSKYKEYKQKRQEEKRDLIKQSQKDWYQTNKEKQKEKAKTYYSENKERDRSKWNERKRNLNKSRREVVDEFKLDKSCVECGENRPYVLDFHHTDPSTKLFEIGEATKHSIKNIKIEMDKCILLCRNCHAELHYKENLK